MTTRARTWWFLGALAALGCASGGASEPDGGTRPTRDGGVDAAAADAGDPSEPDAGRHDGGHDGGDACGGVTCMPFQFCEAGRCRDYPACGGDGSCPGAGEVCHNRRCVPGHVDVDGDGSPASEDCDETNPSRFPANREVCDGVDNDCDGVPDDGDSAWLCELDPAGGVCVEGTCGCPDGTYDFDRAIPGCECEASPALGAGLSCTDAIDLGDLSDVGQSQRVSGNVLPGDRAVWYRFRGVDTADTTCDNYHVRALFLANPDDTFELTVFRGTCETAGCDDAGFTDYNWATDFRQTLGGRLTGQCPCYTAGATASVSLCRDDTSAYFVRVRRRATSTLACQRFEIELSNGVYDTVP